MSRATYTAEQKAEAIRLRVEDGLKETEIGKRLHIPRGTINQWLIQAEAERPSREAELMRQNKALRARMEQVRETNVSAEYVRKEIIRIAASDPAPPSWVPATRKIGQTSTPLAILSDLHFGETTDLAATNGINEYSIPVAKARLKLWVEKLLSQCFDYPKQTDYPGLVLALGGDMVSGDIHDELKETNGVPVLPAMLELLDELLVVIPILKREFKRLHIPCTFGNHGRNTKQVRFKRRAYSNYDWLLSCLLQKYLKNDRNITWTIPSSTDTYFAVSGRSFMLTHGDALGARGGDGFIGPLGPIKRGEGKARRASERMRMPFQHLVHGHWHTQFIHPGILSNGCVCGYNEYAKDELRAEPEPAQQILAFIDEVYGVVDYRPLFLDTTGNDFQIPFGGLGVENRPGLVH